MRQAKIKPVQANNKPYRDNPDMDKENGLTGILDTLQDGKQDGINKDPDGIPDAQNGISKTDILSVQETLYTSVLQVIAEYEIINCVKVVEISQLQYNDVLLYIRDNIVIPIHIDIRNIDLLTVLADVYIRVSTKYKKSVSVMGYSHISNIDYDTLNTWYRSSSRSISYIDITNNSCITSTDVTLYKIKHPDACIVEMRNTSYKQLIQKIVIYREHSLTDKAEDGSVMSLALGKIEYGWIEGRDKQIQADILEQYRKPSDILQNYEQMLLEHDGQ